MEASEIKETIEEALGEDKADDGFRKRVGVYIGIVAMLLAITTLGSEHATKTMVSANIRASDTYAYYQARNIRETATQLAADDLETLKITRPDLSAEARAAVDQRIAALHATVARFESDPARGEGKKQLEEKAQRLERLRDRSEHQDESFEIALALFQIGIVLGSVSIVAASRPLVVTSAILAVLATLLAINGFTLLVELPFGV